MDAILNPAFLDSLKGLGVGGVCLLVMIALLTEKGPLRLTRELKAEKAKSAFLEARNVEQSEQLSMILRSQGPAVNAALTGVRQVAEQVAEQKASP